MQVREIEWRDFPFLVENYFALYDEVRQDPDLGISLFGEKPTLSSEVDWFAGLFRRTLDGRSVACVAEESGKAVGLCHVDTKAPTVEGQHIGVLGILVARGFRDRGIGRALLQFAIERCRGKFDLIELSVFATNHRARSLYASLGFRVWGSLPGGIRREGKYTDLEHMVLDLRGPPQLR